MKNLRENQKNKVFKGFRPTLGYVFFVFVFFGFPEGFYKTNKSFEKTKNTKENQRKPKKTNKTLGKTKKTKCLKVSDSPLDMFFVFCFGFPDGFYKTKKSLEKTKNTKEN